MQLRLIRNLTNTKCSGFPRFPESRPAPLEGSVNNNTTSLPTFGRHNLNPYIRHIHPRLYSTGEMARTKGFARRTAPASADTETRTGSAPAQEAAQSTPQDEVQQTEYYPITLKWTWQVIENDRNARYRADLEQASVIISARLAGYYVKAEDLEWAKAIGQKEVERDEAEKAAKKQGQEAKRAGKLPLFSSSSFED